MVGMSHLICHCLTQDVVFRKILNRLSALVDANHRRIDKSTEAAKNNPTGFPKILLFRYAVCVIIRHRLYTYTGYLNIVSTECRDKIKGVWILSKHY